MNDDAAGYAALSEARAREEQGTCPLAESDLLKLAELGETGAALAYQSIARGKVVLPAGSDTPLIFTGHYWEPDRTGWHRTDLLNRVVEAYIKLHLKLLKEGADKRIIRTVKRIRDLLLSNSGQRRILELAFKGVPDGVDY